MIQTRCHQTFSTAWMRRQDIFVCHNGHNVRLSNHSGIDSCWVLVGRLATQVWLRTISIQDPGWFRGCQGGGTRKMPEEGVCHVYIRVEAPYHPIGQGHEIHCRGCHARQENTKNSDMSDFLPWWWPHNRAWCSEFVSRNQIVHVIHVI